MYMHACVSSRFSSNSEANVSELLEISKKCFLVTNSSLEHFYLRGLVCIYILLFRPTSISSTHNFAFGKLHYCHGKNHFRF